MVASRLGASMTNPRSALSLCVLLVFGLTLMVSAEDLTETAFDESEATPCESTALTSNLMPQATDTAHAVRSAPRRQSLSPFRLTIKRSGGAGTLPFATARVALASLCTLLC